MLGESTCILYTRGPRTVISECDTYIMKKKIHVIQNKDLTITRDTLSWVKQLLLIQI